MDSFLNAVGIQRVLHRDLCERFQRNFAQRGNFLRHIAHVRRLISAAADGFGRKVRAVRLNQDAVKRHIRLSMELVMCMVCAMAFGLAAWVDYEREWVRQASDLRRASGATHMVFGDIDVQAHRDWEEQVCVQAGLTACLPLWLESRTALLSEMLQLGLRALIVSARADCVDLLGEILDEAVIRSLIERGADACGENGEYHTCVLDMPGFARALQVRLGEREYSPEGYGFLRIALKNEGETL